MKILEGQYARIMLNNGLTVEGIIESMDENMVVTNPDNGNFSVIFNVEKNVSMVNVFNEVRVVPREQLRKGVVEPPPPVLDEFEPHPTARAVKVANAHMQQRGSLKTMLQEHFRQPAIPVSTESHYDTPDFTR